MASATKRRQQSPVIERHQTPLVPTASAAPAEVESAGSTGEPVYQGDLYGYLIWFGGALLLALMHIGDLISYLLRR